MSLLRRSAFRLLASSPSRIPALVGRSRQATTYIPSRIPSRTLQWIATPSVQRRFFSRGESLKSAEPTDAENTANAAPVAGDSADMAASAITEAEVGIPEPPAETTAAADPAETHIPNGLDAAAAVDPSAIPSQPSDSESTHPRHTVYIGNLYFETTEAQLRQVFGEYGEIQSVKIATDNRGLSRGFAFVQFSDPENATRAIAEQDQQILAGRRMAVQLHRPKPRTRSPSRPPHNPPTKTLFIGNMSFEMSDRDLNELFRDIRNVLDVRVAIDRRSGQPRGFAHADFLDVQSAEEAYDVLKDKVIYGRKLRIDYSMPSAQRQSHPE